MNNLQQTLLRSVLKVGAGYLISKGLLDQEGGEVMIAALLALIGVVWGIMHRTAAGRVPAIPGNGTPNPVPVLHAPKDSNGNFRGVILLSGLAVLLLGGSGCALFSPAVPTTELNATVAGQKFSLSNPKNTTISGLTCEVETNGTARLTIETVSSTNDVQVVDKSYAGQAMVIQQVGVIAHQAAQDALAGAGTVAGAAAKAP